jgi:ABC-2 type transport system ATP-binding protein
LGKTIFLTTHFMDEAQQLADRVAVMRGGEIIAEGRPQDIGGRDLRPAEIRFVLPEGYGLDDLPAQHVERRSLSGDEVLLVTREPVRAAHALTAWALDRDLDLAHFAVAQPTLEDIYLELTGSASENPSAPVKEVAA